MAANALRAALSRIGWSAQAQVAFTSEGFGSMDDVGLVTRDFLYQLQVLETLQSQPYDQ